MLLLDALVFAFRNLSSFLSFIDKITGNTFVGLQDLLPGFSALYEEEILCFVLLYKPALFNIPKTNRCLVHTNSERERERFRRQGNLSVPGKF